MRNEFTYVVEPPTDEDRWFIAYCPELPEANGQGETEDEAIASLRGAIELILDYRREQGLRGVPTTAHRGTVTIG
jgi:predicted RNase H-like HicB family nuclease